MGDKNDVKFIVRPMNASDLPEVRQIFTSRNLFASKYHHEFILREYPGAIVVAQDENTGNILGICSGLNLSPELAFIGQYRVKDEYQGSGIGTAIWRKVIENIGPDRNIALFASPPISNVFQNKCNFKVFDEITTHCYSGKVDCNLLVEAIDGISVVPISDHNIQKVIQYDKQVFKGLDRSSLIKEKAKITEYVTKIAVNVKGDVLGYCMLKVTNQNKVMAEPLYADNEKIAELLLRKCLEANPNSMNGLMIRCRSDNPKALAIAEKLNLEFMFRSFLLFTKRSFEGNMDRVYFTSSGRFYPF